MAPRLSKLVGLTTITVAPRISEDSMPDAGRTASDTAQKAADSKPLELVARAGLIAYGLVHLLIGWIALRLAWGGSGEEADQSGALQALAQQPFGPVLLWSVAVGLVALAAWQASQAIWSAGGGDRPRRALRKLTAGAAALAYLVLAASAASFAMGSGSSAEQVQQRTAQGMLGLPFGQLLVGVVGLGIIGIGVAQMRKSSSSRFRDEIGSTSMPADMRRVITLLGRMGYAAKGVAFAVVGLLLVYAAATFDPGEAKGLDGALRTIAEQPFGQIGLTAVAVGFVAFGIFACVQSRFRPM